MSQQHNGIDAHMFVLIAGILLVVLVLPTIYAVKAESINSAVLFLVQIQLRPFVPFSQEAQRAYESIAGLNPAMLSWEQMQQALHYAGSWLRFPCAFFLVLLGTASLMMGRTERLTRRFTMEKLLANNAESFACLRPIVGKGKELLSPESYDTGLWRIARSPVQFAVEHGLLAKSSEGFFTEKEVLQNGLAHPELPAYGQAYLDEEKTAKVLQGQLGKSFEGYRALSSWRKALASAFLAYGAGDKEACMEILDALSTSYIEVGNIPQCPIVEDEGFQEKLFALWQKYESVLNNKYMECHTSFELVWFMALLTFARKKGVLASSQFLWLRPYDRSLWYALNQCGGRVAWPEGFAAWAHYTREEKARKAILETHMAHAVSRFKETLAQSGILAEDANELVSSGEGISGDVVFYPAEKDPDYDAHADEDLDRELY